MNTHTSERLQSVRAALEARGVCDVKFYFERGCLTSHPSSEVAAKVADFMDCYLRGEGKAVTVIGDEV